MLFCSITYDLSTLCLPIIQYEQNIKHLRYFHIEALPPPLPFRHKLCQRSISFLPSLNTQIACSMKRGQTKRRIPSNHKNKHETHGPDCAPKKKFQSIYTKHNLKYTKHRLCKNIQRKKSIISFLRIERWLSIKTWIPFTQRNNAPSFVFCWNWSSDSVEDF